MPIQEYLNSVERLHKAGNATEHTYRGALARLIESLDKNIQATNEPKRQKCGAPDYILTKKDIPVGFIEAKDIGDNDLEGAKKTANKEQFDRYKSSLNNIIFTDYLDFHLYRDGQFVRKIAIAKVTGKTIERLHENFASFENFIRDFCTHIGQNIKSPKKLAEMMAGKARLLSEVIEKALTSDETNHEDSTLKDQMNAFKEILIHDITPKGFADVYAQTIAYGMFAARLHDPTLETFSRQEAYELIPKSNPFLKKLFGYIAGLEVDDRIKWIVDDLVNIFLACNVEEILKNYGKDTKTEDPIIHFYETFLSEYDPKLRKARGVWYTPAPVVNFIVRAVDDILKKEFDLKEGLADNSKTKITVDTDVKDGRSKTGFKQIEQEIHKVQILDPATGTGTFLAEIIRHVYKKFEGQQGIWSKYAENHLLPRLNGFELLMASYAIAHLKLDLLLTETGYKSTTNQRFRVYLTNSLEEHHPDTGTLFASWLSSEANEANHIKRDTPVMVVIGNPPYSVSSSNKGEWIQDLVADYKKDLNEKNINPLSDDYIKFIRYAQYFIDKNGQGIIAMITNNSFIDGIIHRKMRESLSKSFDKIYILDLHGNSKKQEKALDGSVDQNVFDIMQGVSISIFVRQDKKSRKSPEIYHYDLYGNRESKYQFLWNNSIDSVNWKEIKLTEPYNFFVPKDFSETKDYEKGFGVGELFGTYASGVKTEKDYLTIQFSNEEIESIRKDFLSLSEIEIRQKYQMKPDGRDWNLDKAIIDLKDNCPKKAKIQYRPFDDRFTFYTGKTKGFHAYPRNEIMRHMLAGDNVGLVTTRLNRQLSTGYFYITSMLLDIHALDSAGDSMMLFPLYLYPDEKEQTQTSLDLSKEINRKPNLNPEVIKEVEKKLKLKFISEKEEVKDTFSPIDLLDYIYAVLHSPSYREKYKEFLKIDFPRVPYPENKNKFWQLVEKGKELRELHLLESPKVSKYITSYPSDGNNVIEAKYPRFENGRVYINEEQYFDGVPQIAWEFYIGGYQPAQKWLKDRRGRELNFDDILHYQKVIVALTETARIMKEIDEEIALVEGKR